MNFEELMEALRGEEPPDTIYDDLTAAYNDMVEGSRAKLAESDEVISALNGEIEKLKAQNFDLLMAAPKPDAEPAADEHPADEPEDRPENDDDLFSYERD